MIPILSADSYRGFSSNLALSGHTGAQPAFIGRLIWPGVEKADDAVFKLYETDTCGIANEVIGYLLNEFNGITQPKSAAIVLLSPERLLGVNVKLDRFIDLSSGMVACWATSFEQNTKPYRFVRRLSSFTERQTKAFYKSAFCKRLSSVDHITGNNDRHEGNFLYVDDLNYFAIDQGCVGGGLRWHTTWPDRGARNELLELARSALTSSELATWIGQALIAHGKSAESWIKNLCEVDLSLQNLLSDDARDTIVEYMNDRAVGATFATSCGRLI